MYKRKFTILSRGTEKKSKSDGYMWIGSNISSQDYIIAPVSHHIEFLNNCPEGSLKCGFCKDLNIIAFCRFALMSNILLYSNSCLFNNKNLKIAIVGAGAVGITACYEFLKFGFKDIDIIYKEKHYERISSLKEEISHVRLESFNPTQYKIIVDATGNSNTILDIIKKSNPHTKIFLLGVPFEDPSVNILDFYRKNLTLIGCHELRVSNQTRQDLFLQLLNDYSTSYINFSNFINYYSYDNNTREQLLSSDTVKPINIFKFR